MLTLHIITDTNNSLLTPPGGTKRALQLSANNNALKQQLDTARQAVGNLKEEVCKLLAMKKEAENQVQANRGKIGSPIHLSHQPF